MKRFHVVINQDKCKGCELCRHACKKGVIGVAKEVNLKGYHPAAVLNDGACVGCKSCAVMCPDCAIEIFEKEADEA